MIDMIRMITGALLFAILSVAKGANCLLMTGMISNFNLNENSCKE
jgi:hypothetical protein